MLAINHDVYETAISIKVMRNLSCRH